jgi:aromatic ring-cleaving dioxygenase
MTIRKTNVVDWLGLEKGTGDVLLTIVDDDDWANEQEHLELLQENLNSYLAFIESGEVYERLAVDVGRAVSTRTPVKVSILAKYPVPPHVREFLNYAQGMFEGAGFVLAHKVLPVPG